MSSQRVLFLIFIFFALDIRPALCAPETLLRGAVRDRSEKGVEGVTVRCFWAGEMIQEVKSGRDGGYELRLRAPQKLDLIWYDRQGFMPRVIEAITVWTEYRIDVVMWSRSESFTLASGLAQIHSLEALGYYFLAYRDLPHYSLVSAYEDDVSLLNVPGLLKARVPPLVVLYSSMKKSDKQRLPSPVSASPKTGGSYWEIPPPF